ncbi:MAG TPA: hypothetical protein VE521_05170 [Nitrososphaera sp.]|jgi:hypothetical protein|nr:hypothetical protein [Thermoproteota archaeon]MDQ3969722.1 hypothetical protein [Thermoproteota archaeon]HZA48299.1 hypothetical protein [Nitrososphaera sp.]
MQDIGCSYYRVAPVVFYHYSPLEAITPTLLAGAFTVVAPEAYRKMIKQKKRKF